MHINISILNAILNGRVGQIEDITYLNFALWVNCSCRYHNHQRNNVYIMWAEQPHYVELSKTFAMHDKPITNDNYVPLIRSVVRCRRIELDRLFFVQYSMDFISGYDNQDWHSNRENCFHISIVHIVCYELCHFHSLVFSIYSVVLKKLN